MRRRVLVSLAALGLMAVAARPVLSHCQVPCGIYADQHRFERMLEDQTTIAKAIASIQELAGKTDPLSVNQITRWVNAKEEHAKNTQQIIAEYFMTQRLKPGTDEASQAAFVKKLTAAHAVMVAAMKVKQTVDPVAAETLKKAILDFYRAYEGKEPQLTEKK